MMETNDLGAPSADRAAAPIDWRWDEYDLNPIVERTPGTRVEIARTVHSNHAHTEDLARAFVPGIAYEHDPATRMFVDFGEGLMDSGLTGRPGFYMNVLEGTVHREYEGTCEITFPAVPPDELSRMLGLSEDSIERLIRPLHDRYVADAVVPALTSAMWDAAAAGRTYASLFLDQVMTAMALHIFELARGPDWMRRPDLEWQEDGRVRARLRNGNTLARLEDARLRRAIDYVETNLGKALTIAEIADAAALSPAHFAAAFKAATGEAPWAFVRRRRLERAQELLRGTPLPIGEIAHVCGFADQPHLTRAFKRRFGVTPAKARD